MSEPITPAMGRPPRGAGEHSRSWLAAAGIAVAAFLAALTLVGRADAAPLSTADQEFVDSTVAAAMSAEKTPGLSISISGPAGEYSKAYGWARMGLILNSMQLADHVRIGSVTKTLTATAILQQIELGNLSYSDTLDEFVSGIEYGNEITVRDLLDMQSGVYEFESDPAFQAAVVANPAMQWEPEDTVNSIREHEPEFKPGEYVHYNESNYVLLGLILEDVTGETAEAAITKDVINPLGLTQTSLPAPTAAEPAPTKMPEPFAHGYNRYVFGFPTDTTNFNARIAWTMGGIVSTVGDLATWGHALGTGALLGAETFAERTQFCGAGAWTYGGPTEFGYGLGLMSLGNWVGHPGSVPGFSAATFYEPETGAEITVVENLQSPTVAAFSNVFEKIAAHLYPESMETPEYPESPACPPAL
jgi:CubicO group peptidase (beta-lactamase class C family)